MSARECEVTWSSVAHECEEVVIRHTDETAEREASRGSWEGGWQRRERSRDYSIRMVEARVRLARGQRETGKRFE